MDVWIRSYPVQSQPEKEEEEGDGPKDSVSLVSQRSSRVSHSSSESACKVGRAEKAALLAKAAALKQGHALEKKEESLVRERDEIRTQRETLKLESELYNHLIAILNRQNEISSMLPKQQQMSLFVFR